MKGLFLFFVLCAVFATISCLPEPEEGVDQPANPWFPAGNPYSYSYMMCRLKCRQSCLEQGYWKGVCKQGACYCFGPMGPYGRVNGFPISPY